MRGAIWAVVLLLAPLASGLGLHPLPDDAAGGREALLVLDDGVWTSERWSMLEEQGVQPLRSVRSDALLVWMNAADNAQRWAPGISVEAPEPAELRLGLDTSGGPGDYRVLLEPRLPDSGVEAVQSRLNQLGLPVLSSSLDVTGNLPGSFTVSSPSLEVLRPVLDIDGVLWVEPVLVTHARNGQAAALLQDGMLDNHPYWTLGLNASGIVVGVADSGIDADHACFRNATTSTGAHAEPAATYPAVGQFGEHHRKILHLNTTIDGNDTPGQSDYRHGTHVIGSLACHDVHAYRQDAEPGNGSTLAHGARLVVQDIVSSEGWVPPNVDALLWESSSYGGLVHSNSWGDDTTAYTERTSRFDAYARVMPWSLALIAPGNSGEGVLEPANGRNVVAVSATSKNVEEGRWGSSAYGPTEIGTDGIFVLAPGSSIQSAGADGFWNTNNDNLRSSSGTSMSTPHASGAVAVIQQLYEDGWLVPANAPLTPHHIRDFQPAWAEDAPMMRAVYLGDGFTPSGSLLRASLALAASPLPDESRNGGEGGYQLHNPYDGWGVLNLSQLFDPDDVVNGQSPTRGTWVHDSYRLSSGSVAEWFAANGGETSDLAGMVETGASLEDSVGPFLQTGDVFTQRLALMEGEDVRIRMAFPAQPEPAMVDDLQLRVRLEDGTILLPDRLREGGFAPTMFYPEVADTNDTAAFPSTNETVVGIDIPQSYLFGSSYIDVDVTARFVQPGGEQGTTGLDGDAVGFALIVKGVDRDSRAYDDDDGDGVLNKDDPCPSTYAPVEFDADGNGCLDDDDGDGVPNRDDACPASAAVASDDADRDGCLDDDDGDGVPNTEDLCPSVAVPAALDVNRDGCDDANQWQVSMTFSEGCLRCAIEVRSVVIQIDQSIVHDEFKEGAGTLFSLTDNPGEDTWNHVLSQRGDDYDMADFSNVVLQVNLAFVYSDSATSGRQDMCWYFGTCSTWEPPPPPVSWRVDVELRNGQQAEMERVVTLSSEQYTLRSDYELHTFNWSKHPVVDADGDGYTEPGVEYDGLCGVDIPHSYYQPNRGQDYPCDLLRYNVNDVFPNNPTQWVDSDGDGYGDNSSGTEGDAFPDNPGQWSDVDGDGFGDNTASGGWDDCPYRWGNSTQNLLGCPDADGDGFSDVCGLDWCGAESAWGPNGYSYSRGDTTDSCPSIPGSSYETRYGCPDSDGDGWADPSPASDVGISDACPNEYGKAISKDWRGCPDADGDGWADVEDDFPQDPEFWLDSDNDGVPDEEDDYPENYFLSSDETVEMAVCWSLCFGITILPVLLGRMWKGRTKSVSLDLDLDMAPGMNVLPIEPVQPVEQAPPDEDSGPPTPMVVGKLGEEHP